MIKVLAYFAHLIVLNLSNNDFSGGNFGDLKKIFAKGLKILDLSSCFIGDREV